VVQRIRCLLGFVVAACLAVPVLARAQGADPQILLVPASPEVPSLPFSVHERAQMTLKGILRNANCAQGYSVRWDTNRNDNYDDDAERIVTPANGTVYDIGRVFTVPDVRGNTRININVRVRNRCNNATSTGSFRLFVYDWQPAGNPTRWTADQIELMANMALHESLWYIHRWQRGHAGVGAQLQSRFGAGGHEDAGTALAIWAMAINGRFPAYPPGTIDAFGQPLDAQWVIDNENRWTRDPYAETTARMLNYVLNRGTALVDISAEDESNLCRLVPGGNPVEQACRRLAGTADSRGAYSNGGGDNVYYQGVTLGSLASLLPTLAGTRLQVGGLRGQTYEYLIQQMADLLGAMQIDGGCAGGGFYYNRLDGNYDCVYSDGSTSQWGYIGLESVEFAGRQLVGRDFDVFVSNRHKYRIANNLIANQQGDGASAYRNSGDIAGGQNMQLTGGAFVGGRWLGMNSLNAGGNDRPFAPYSNHTSAQLRQSFERTVQFTANNWGHGPGGWYNSQTLWSGGDYLCGNRNSVYSWGADARCGNLYAIYSHQKGYRTGDGAAQGPIGGHDWTREFNVYVMRSQDRNLGDYDGFGRVSDCGPMTSISCAEGNSFTTSVAALVLTPTIFNPRPVAIATARPTTVIEGCAGGNNGQLVFSHAESFHPNPATRILAYQWDVNDQNGLWWDQNNAPQDFTSGRLDQDFAYRFPQRGTYTATLRLVDQFNITGMATVPIQVEAAPNVAPVAAHGGPYVLETGENLTLAGTASDANTGCGDRITIAWDLDNDGQYDDAATANPVIPWATVQTWGLRIGTPHNITLRVRDAAGDEAVATTQITLYERDPVAEATATPNPARCPQQVTFDGSRSRHPNPNRSIVSYQWDVDGVPGFDGGNARFTYTYQRFGTYPAILRVTDDRGRFSETRFDVDVTMGNSGPVAMIADALHTVLEGQDLVLDGRPSSDADLACGDTIVGWDWDVNGDGDMNDVGVDGTGDHPRIPWATLAANLAWPADPQSGLPDNTIRLRVTDSFGASNTTFTKVRILRSTPEAIIVQLPDPAPVAVDTGLVQIDLDARGSSTPVPGQSIVRYQWDLNDDGQYGDAPEQAEVAFRRIFNPIPPAGDVRGLFVRLRVTDSAGQVAEVRRELRMSVGATAPTADADPNDLPEPGYHVLLGDALELFATQSADPDENDWIRFYRWDLDGDGIWDEVDEDANGDGAEAELTISAQRLVELGLIDLGEYPIRLQVEDTTGRRNEDVSTLTLHARAPQAIAAANPPRIACGQRVVLDGSASRHTHPDLDIVSWQWDLDHDGAYDDANGEAVNAQFDRFSFAGSQRVGLRVTDSAGGTGVTLLEIPIDQGNTPPNAVAGGPYVLALGEEVRLDGSASTEADAACGDAIVSFGWDVGDDGVVDFVSPNSAVLDLSWAQLQALNLGRVGRHTVRIVATDRFGVASSARTTLDVFQGPTAVAEATPARVGCDVLVELDGGGSFSDGPADLGFALVDWAWDLGDDGVVDGHGRTISRSAAGQARVQARLTVTDAAGRESSTVVVVDIVSNNVAPVAAAGGPYATGPVGNGFAAVTLDARGSRDPNEPCDEVVRYKWDTDDDGLFGADDVNGAGNRVGSDYEGATVPGYTNPRWAIGLVQIVRVEACDTSGACSAAAESELVVRNEAPPQGEVLAPRGSVDTCIPAGDFDLVYRVRHPTGDSVIVVAMAGEVQLATETVDTPDDGSFVERRFVIDAGAVPEGRVPLTLSFTDLNGDAAVADSGGAVLFDRTQPIVSIGNQIIEDNCYAGDRVPVPLVAVTDNLDNTPLIDQVTQVNGCQRQLDVTAEDRCGNAASATRSYRVAEPVQLDLTGPAENALVAEARLNWRVVGSPSCANEVTALINENGVRSVVYVANTPISVPGNYTLDLTVPDCLGNERHVLRAFRINGPPDAVAVPGVHPNRDPNAPVPTYAVAEGSPLQLDGSSSRAAEDGDAVVEYAWDLDNDGTFEVRGARPDFATVEDGLFPARLQVTDTFALTNVEAFEIRVQDVHPVVRPGGPVYRVRQGQALQLDGTLTRPGSAADPISGYTWTFGDGTPAAAGPQLTQPTHTWDRDGIYTVRLTVDDEDSRAFAEAQVNVADVNPVIVAVEQPDDVYEHGLAHFRVTATPGAPADPIVSYEFDFDDDGTADLVLPDGEGDHQFRTAGRFSGTLRVRDTDSAATQPIAVTVREMTLTDLLTEIRRRAQPVAEDPARPARVRSALSPSGQPTLGEWIDRGLWAEAQGYHGNTLVALDELAFRISRAQAIQPVFGDLLWIIATEVEEEVEAAADRLADLLPAGEPNLVRAGEFLDQSRTLTDAADFAARVSGIDEAYLVRDALAALQSAWFFVEYADYERIHGYGGFPMPDDINPIIRVQNAEVVNQDLVSALAGLAAEMGRYADAGGAGAPAPGRDEVLAALQVLTTVRGLVGKDIGLRCDGPACITDAESLDLQLGLMDLVGQMFAAARQGVYVRGWQNVLVLAIKFRVELSVLRLEDVCGAFTPVVLSIRSHQRTLLAMVAREENEAALSFYTSPDRRCLALRGFNECIVPVLPEDNRARAYPEFCAEAAGDEDVGGGAGPGLQGDPEIPYRAPLRELALLLDIIGAFFNLDDPMDPAVREALYPGRAADDFDRDHDAVFDVADVDLAIQQFNHDLVDRDADGLRGLIEVDCRLAPSGLILDPDDPTTVPGRDDGTHDCDLDGLQNAVEVTHGMNALAAADADLDRDGDGITNRIEILNGFDIDRAQDGLADDDGDGLTNAQELNNRMNPDNAFDAGLDFDVDGLINRVEILNGLDPRDGTDADADPDGDGLTSRQEIARGRNPLVADCAADVREFAQRNDTAELAQNLGNGNRTVVADGRLCAGVGGPPDQDWYRFEVEEPSARVVVTLSFDAGAADLDLRLYDAADGVQLARSSTAYGTEFVFVPRGERGPGAYFVRIYSPDGDEAPYALDVRVLPTARPCTPDAYEGAVGNNVQANALPVGPEAVRQADAWICADERRTGDWYRVVADQRDLTIHLAYDRATDGQLRLAATTQDLQIFEESLEAQTNVQCINVRATGVATPVFVNVVASSVFSDGDDRVDYVMQIIETDLQANPRGACDTLSGGQFGFVTWPILDL
jgi:PKD repeat protein